MKNIPKLISKWGLYEIVFGICIGLLVSSAGFAIREYVSNSNRHPSENLTSYHLPQFGAENPSSDVRSVANWVATTNDARGRGFIIIDKKEAKMYVFDDGARLQGASAVLLGLSKGDSAVGPRPLSEISPSERITPAGRFVGERGHDARKEDVVWVDYAAAISIHRVLTTNPSERRLERLATPTVSDNRISSGCINVPVHFYEAYVQPLFAAHRALVYILPDVKTLKEVFGEEYAVTAQKTSGTLSPP